MSMSEGTNFVFKLGQHSNWSSFMYYVIFMIYTTHMLLYLEYI